MGCGTPSSSIHDPQQIYQTPFGIITINLLNMHLYPIEGNFNKMGTYYFVKLKMNNQTQNSTDFLPPFQNINSESQFSVNSRHFAQGRILNIQVYEKGSIISTGFMGFGNLDLDFLLKTKKLQNMKIYLEDDNKKVGWIQIKAQFLPCETEVFTVMFDSLIIRRKTSFGTMNCKIKAQIGQQIIQTSVSKDEKDKPASWKGEMYTFYYLKQYHKQGSITVYDGNTIIGSMVLNIQEFDQNVQQYIQIKEEFHLQGQVAGILSFVISKGDKKIQSTSLLARSAVVSPSKSKKPFDRSKLLQKSKISQNNITIRQEPQNNSQTHQVNLNQQPIKNEEVIESKDQAVKIQLFRQAQLSQDQAPQKKVDDNLMNNKNEENPNPINVAVKQQKLQVNQIKQTQKQPVKVQQQSPIHVQNIVNTQTAKNDPISPPKSQQKKQEQNPLVFQEKDPQPLQKAPQQVQNKANQQVQPKKPQIKEEVPPKQSDKVNVIDINDTKTIQIKPSSNQPFVEDADLSPEQDPKPTNNQQNPVVNE